MITIGVTGGVGTGKSTVSRMLGELGAAVVDADELVHRLILPDGPAYPGLVKEFGPGILAPDGSIDRRKLAAAAFADDERVNTINSLIHPHVTAAIKRRAAELAAGPEGAAVLVLDVPLLYESGLDKLCDQVWVVTADPAVRRDRVAQRDGPNRAAGIINREAWQMPLADKAARADAVIDNSGDPAATRAQVARLWRARGA